MNRISNTIKNTLVSFRNFYRRLYRLRINKALLNRDFTIISNNCIAGIICHDLNVTFNTPTINLFFSNLSEFIKYVNNLSVYSNSDLVEKSNNDKEYPVGYLIHDLGNIELHFMHYHSFEEAKNKWIERSKRINYENIYVVMELGIYTTQDLFDEFNNIVYKNKVAIINDLISGNSFKMGIYDKGYKSGKLLEFKTPYSLKRYLDEFDYISFLNTGDIKPRK